MSYRLSIGSRIFFRTSLVPSITYILAIKIGKAVFEKIWFFDFSKFVYNFGKFFFSSWYLMLIHLVVVATYPCNMDQIPAGAPRPCLSCYGLWYKFFDPFLLTNETRLTLSAATDKVNNEYSWRFYHTSGACIPT